MSRETVSVGWARRWCWRANGRTTATWLHAHFIHTPASVTEYASILTGVPWTCSAHAKDIWTSPDWELNEKLGSARWTVTCTRSGYEHMRSADGAQGGGAFELSRPGSGAIRPFCRAEALVANGSDPADPVSILSVGRAVERRAMIRCCRPSHACRQT